jgi:DNA excision repair protein ERCC-2
MKLFPFDRIREGQRDFLEDSRKAVTEGKHLAAHAPTGIGKTAAVIAPSLEYALENNKTLFFLTPKHTQHTIIVDTLKRIKKKVNVDFITVDIIGKQWTCPHTVRDLDSREFNEFCRSLKKDERCKYYRNVRKRKLSENAKRTIERIKKETLHSEEISKLCSDNMLCPYEVCIGVGKDATVIVCDYFHIFSPKVRQAFLSKLNKGLENSILIIDEAHNLPDRVRKLLSHKLTEYTLKRAMKEANFLGYEHLSDDFWDTVKVIKDIGGGMKPGGEKIVGRD